MNCYQEPGTNRCDGGRSVSSPPDGRYQTPPSYDGGRQTQRPFAPDRQATPAWGMGQTTQPMFRSPMMRPVNFDRFPIGMAYVPMQSWQQQYSLEQGFRRGTIFPELDLPFMMGRCR